MANYRYGPYDGGPDPLTSPYDVREWKADIDAIVFADPGAIAAWSDEVKRPGEVRATQPR